MPSLRALSLFLLVGCVSCSVPTPDQGKQVSDVLTADPRFKTVLDKRDECASRIETAEREFALKRQNVERGIERLKQELAEGEATLKKKKSQLAQLLDPDRKRLDLDKSMSEDELQAKREQRANVGRTIVKLRKALKDATVWTPQEKQRQEAHLQDMLEDIKRLDREMEGIKAHIRLLKMKLSLLRL